MGKRYIKKKFKVCFNEVSNVFQGSFKGGPRKIKVYFKDFCRIFLRMSISGLYLFPDCFEIISWVFLVCIKYVEAFFTDVQCV